MDGYTYRRLWTRFHELVSTNADELNQLDAAIGDADHGTNMTRGLTKVIATFEAAPPVSVRTDAKTVGMTLLSTVGGASGALWGSGMLKFSAALPDSDRMTFDELAAGLGAFVDSVSQRGKAVPGDKTMIDVFVPALAELVRTRDPEQAAEVAKASSDATKDLVARRGRAAYLGERSRGHIDPGSVSAAMWFQALAETLRDEQS